jgi:hypothetical protein
VVHEPHWDFENQQFIKSKSKLSTKTKPNFIQFLQGLIKDFNKITAILLSCPALLIKQSHHFAHRSCAPPCE